MSMKEQSTSARSKSLALRRKYPKGLLLPESEIQELVFNLRVGEALAAGMRLLVIEEAVKAIVEDAQGRETNVRLISKMEREEECRPIQRMIEAIILATEQGAEGRDAACLTITRFLEFAFGYPPDHGLASRLYTNKLRIIRQKLNAASK